jgi:hypothetical protein
MPPELDTPILATGTSAAPNDTGRKLALNFFLLVAGEMTAKVLTFASLTYLARTLGPTD